MLEDTLPTRAVVYNHFHPRIVPALQLQHPNSRHSGVRGRDFPKWGPLVRCLKALLTLDFTANHPLARSPPRLSNLYDLFEFSRHSGFPDRGVRKWGLLVRCLKALLVLDFTANHPLPRSPPRLSKIVAPPPSYPVCFAPSIYGLSIRY